MTTSLHVGLIGVGRSGHGREKGFEGLRSYTRIKTIAIHHG